MLSDVLAYLTHSVEESDLRALRNAFVCGILTFVMLMVGIRAVLMFVIYVFFASAIVFYAWLYTLNDAARSDVVMRIKNVLRTFVRSCIDEVIVEDDQDNGVSSGTPVAETKRRPDEVNVGKAEVDEFKTLFEKMSG